MDNNGNSIDSNKRTELNKSITTTETITTDSIKTRTTRNSSLCPLESVSTTTIQSLDTVRALHHTVVSLRSALEEAKFEIQRLRNQIYTEAEIKEGAKIRQPKIIRFQSDQNDNNNKLSPTNYSPPKRSEKLRNIEIPELHQLKSSPVSTPRHTSDRQHSQRYSSTRKYCIEPDISISTDDDKMSSKIDLKIKVTSNINIGEDIGANNSNPDSDASEQQQPRNPPDFQFTTEDNLTVRETVDGDYEIKRSSKENLTTADTEIDDDDNTPSEGDNSVFELTDNANDAADKLTGHGSKDECDDIELVFSSDGQHRNDEMISLSEFDPWQPTGTSGTPVLVKFSSLQSSDDDSMRNKLPTSSTCDTFTRNLSQQGKNLQNALSLDNHQAASSSTIPNFSLDKKYIHCEDQRKDNNFMGRDESLDFFDNNNDGSMGRKWTNYNVLVETDISKCGITEETPCELYHRRNTCPNPPAYRPMLTRDLNTRYIPSRLASKYCRRIQYNPAGNTGIAGYNNNNASKGPKRSCSAQTEVSALPEYWKSECHLAANRYFIGGPCTLPSKFVPTVGGKKGCQKHNNRTSAERTQEARRVLLSDINFTSMVPELSRSDDDINKQHHHIDAQQSSGYYKGNLLKTPDYIIKGLTPSASMTSPGLSQWTVNENSFGTQTIITGDSWGGKRGDSLDSCRSYSTGSRISDMNRHHRSRSVPSVRCTICQQLRSGHGGIRTSESMHYTPRVTFQEINSKIRGSLPDLRKDCMCIRHHCGRTIFTIHGDSSGSTESLLDEADAFVRKSLDGTNFKEICFGHKRSNLRRMSENDIQRDYIPSKQSLPFLPKTAKCLKNGHLAKVITKSGRVVVGRVRFVGPLMVKSNTENCSNEPGKISDDLYVGIQLQSKCGDCDGTFEGRKFFDCEPLQGLFVPFKKVIMAWSG